ncbi:uncharacterized protein LOC134252407 [Saccostrea cucullata]|uniref:uncharacterized protein LOC134252407 n=1 Tax=Saccostrea cuccullata TaxID=36930 RepID=UPI002ED2439C
MRGADVNSDYHMLLAKVKIKLAKNAKIEKMKLKYNVDKLKNLTDKDIFQLELRNRFSALYSEDQELDIEGNVDSLELANGESNVITLESGQQTSIRLVFHATSVSSYSFSAVLDIGKALDNSSATINSSNMTILYVIQASYMMELSYGEYNVNFTLTCDEDSVTKNMVLVYEERISGFMITTNSPKFLVNTEGIIEASISSGSNVLIEWTWDTNHSCIYDLNGNGSRSFSINLNFTKLGEFNVSFSANNGISNYFTFVVVEVSHGVSVQCPFLSWVSEEANITIKMLPSSNLQEPIQRRLTYGDGSDADIADLSSSHMRTSGMVSTKRYTDVGNFTVSALFFTEAGDFNLTCKILVCEKINASLSFDSYTNDNPVVFHFINKPRFNFDYAVDFGNGVLRESTDTVLNEPYNIQPFTHTYNDSGVYNITSTICTECTCITNSYIINILCNVDSLELANGESNVITLESGQQTSIRLVFHATSGSSYSFSAVLDTGKALENSSASINSSNMTILYVIQASYMMGLSYGEYNVNFTLTCDEDSITMKNMVLVYEERISGFMITTNSPNFLVNTEGIIEASISSGSNVLLEWTWDSNHSCIYDLNGSGSRSFSINLNFTKLGEFNVSFNAHNGISNYFTFVVVEVLHGVSVECPFLAWLSEETNITFKMLPSSNLQEPIQRRLTYGDGSDADIADLSSSQMRTSGMVSTKRYTDVGNFTVSALFFTEAGDFNLTCKILVCEKIHASLSFDSYTKDNPVVFDFTNKPSFNFDYAVDFGNGVLRESTDTVLNEPYNIQPFPHTYNDSGVYNITSTICNECTCTTNSYTINKFSGITLFDVANGGSDVVHLPNGGQSTINLIYDTQDASATYSLTADITSETMLDTTAASIVESNKTVTFIMSSSSMNTLQYGQYELILYLKQTISNFSDTVSKKLLLGYEEAITTTQVFVSPHLVVDEISFFHATLDGSNVVTEWFINTNTSYIYKHEGTGQRTITVNFTISVGGPVNVTVIAANFVSRKINYTMTKALHRIHGMTMKAPVTLLETRQLVTFNLTLDSLALQPQGEMNITIDYDDGSSFETYHVYGESTLTSMQTNGFQFDHTFNKQGNYTVKATLETEVDLKLYTTIIYIWDKLDNVSLLCNKFYAKVKEEITLSFSNVPNSNFQYLIEYDDGTIRQNNASELFWDPWPLPLWKKAYSSPSIYNVRARMFNPFYTKSVTLVIKVEHPILPNEFTLTPVEEEIPIPDGTQTFTLSYNSTQPPPTDVFCTFNFGDGYLEANVSSVITRYNPIVKTHTYTSSGVYSVLFSCFNHISSMNKSSSLTVQSFVLSDFIIDYGNKLKLMNMTKVPFTPNETYRHTAISKPLPVDVKFRIFLKNCSKMPNNIIVEWNFDDGVIGAGPQRSFFKTHKFTQRKNHSMVFTFKNTIDNTEYSFHYWIQMGIVQFTADRQSGIISQTTFQLSAFGMNSATNMFDPDSKQVTMHNDANIAYVTYMSYGTFLPSVIVQNDTMVEEVCLQVPIKVDYVIQNKLSLSVPNATVLLPPGDVEITITPVQPFPFVTCSFTSGDLIDKKEHSKTANITPSEPMIIRYKYQTLGKHNLTFHCSNYAEELIFDIATLYVHNPCFSNHGIFDRNYATYENPMKAYTSRDVFVSSRMQVICIGKTAGFQWDMFRCLNETNKPVFNYVSPMSPLQGTNVYEHGKIPPGIYHITLNVSLEGTWLKENMFISFIKPPPYAFIIGGTKIAAKINEETIGVDALTGSYDAAKGYGNNEDLTFTFQCEAFPSNDFKEIEDSFNDKTKSKDLCTLTGNERGKRILNITTANGYAVTVNVSDGQKFSSFTQFLSILPGNPPDVILVCSINCAEKYAITSKMNVYAQCRDCAPDETLLFSWKLMKVTSGTEEIVDNFEDLTATGLNTATMVIKENSFESGNRYILQLNVSSTAAKRMGFSIVAMDIRTNYPPYNGNCKVEPDEGRAMNDSFDVLCEDWVDEGSSESRDISKDKDAQEPLVYLYEVLTNSSDPVTKREIYRGGESSAINMQLPLGLKELNYTLEIRVYIFDRFGDANTTTTYVRVRPLENILPKDDKDTAGLNKLFDSFTNLLNTTEAGGNDMAVVRLVSSALSYFQQETNEPDISDKNEEGQGNLVDIEEEPEEEPITPVVKLYQEKAKEMAGVLLKSVSSENNTKVFNPTDAQQIAGTLMSVSSNSKYITTESAEKSTKVAQTIMESVVKNAEVVPFPVESIKSIEGAVTSTLTSLDKFIDSLIPEEVYSLDEEISEESVYEELVKEHKRNSQLEDPSIKMDPVDLREKARKRFAKIKKRIEKQREMAKFAKKTAKLIEKALRDMEKISLLQQEVGEGVKTLHRGDIIVVTEKTTLADVLLKNQSEYQGIQLEIVEENVNVLDTINKTTSFWNNSETTEMTTPMDVTGSEPTAISSIKPLSTTSMTTANNTILSLLNITLTETTTGSSIKPLSISLLTTTNTTMLPSLNTTLTETTPGSSIKPLSTSLLTTTTNTTMLPLLNTTLTETTPGSSIKPLSTSLLTTITNTTMLPLLNTTFIETTTNLSTVSELLNETLSATVSPLLNSSDAKTSSLTNANSVVKMQVSVIKKNPYMYGNGSSGITSSVISVNTDGKVAPIIKFKNKNSYRYLQRYTPKTIPKDPERFFYFNTEVKHEDDTIMLYFKPENIDINSKNLTLYTVFVSKTNYPREAEEKHDWKRLLSVRDWTENGFRLVIPPNTCIKGTCFIGLQPVEAKTETKSRKRRAVDNTINETTTMVLTSAKTDATTQEPDLPDFNPSVANFSLAIATTACRTWDEEEEAWVSTGCTVLDTSTLEETNCRCQKTKSSGSIFATTFYVPPNVIHWDVVWSRMDPENAAVYGTLIGLFIIAIILFVFLRKKDKLDLEKWTVNFLADSDASDKYFYLISVHTGMRRGAGTKSNVSFVLMGEELNTEVRQLTDGISEGFQTSSIKHFFMGTEFSLGDLTCLQISHDNAGSGDFQSWYLNKVVIDDVQTRKRYVFLCERWLSLDHDDSAVEYTIPVCEQESLLSFINLFSQHAQKSVTENHLWLSIFIRPERSNFTRVQRLVCLTSFLFLAMLTNAIFFKSSEEEQDVGEIKIGHLRFSMTNLIISIQSIAITTFPIIFVVLIYRKSRQKQMINHKDKYKVEQLNENISKAMEMNKNSASEDSSLDDPFLRNRLPLPHWTVYIAWTVNILAILGSTFYLFLISMQWGKAKSADWLTTFVLNFLESFFIVDPLKVMLVAVILALLFKRSPDGEVPSVSVEELKKTVSLFKGGVKRSDIVFLHDLMKPNVENTQNNMQKLKEKRKQEMHAKEALFTLFFYALFIFIMYSISFIERDQRSYHLKTNIHNYLFQETKSKMNKTEDFYNWMDTVFIPIYYPTKNYANLNLNSIDKMWFGDMANIRVGPGRIRQVRMKKVECDYYKLTWSHVCVEMYNEYEEDEDKYCVGWTTYNASVCETLAYKNSEITADAWKFTKSSDIWGSPFMGEYATYGGGGYILKFTKNLETAKMMIDEIRKHNWIDRGTRAIFVEFTLYNGNTHLFTYITFSSETTETGGVFNWVEIRPFRPLLSLDSLGTYSLACYIMFFIYQIALTVQTVRVIRKEGIWLFLKMTWNIVDSVCLVLGYSAIGIYVTRMSYANKAMDIFYDDLGNYGEDRFVNFNHIVIWDQTYNAVVAVLVFTATLRIIRIMGYNKKFTEIVSVITGAANELISFGIVFVIIFSGFVISGYLLFGRNLMEYQSIFQAWTTLTNALIGKNSLQRMSLAAPYFAQVYYFTYVLFVIFTLITVFAAILNTSISHVRQETAQLGDIYGIFDMLKKSVRTVFGVIMKEKKKSKESQDREEIRLKARMFSQIDASNILKLIRDVFDDFPATKEFTDTPMGDEREFSTLFRKTQRFDREIFPRVETPGNILISLDTENRKKKLPQPYFVF